MSARHDFQEALNGLDASGIRDFLTAHSGLPGPRGNVELIAAFGDVAPPGVILGLVGSQDEYLASCAAAALGRLVADGDDERRAELLQVLHAEARDARWRVREGVAMALQRLGDADGAVLRAVVASWAADPDPLVQRAAVAGVCEPRLLKDGKTARGALDACRSATDSLARRPMSDRRNRDVRALRQGLGYCWSVAIAGDPEHGLPAFAELETSSDADVRWIVRENRKKARLKRLLPSSC
ncbi:HEAT repeat domain-containing protein [Cellulomonas humilata]|uniref:HEAT repeat domain-containing protein n=1 Tax=Cellulomonas humilata TaxID=144055 RepID=A0A7Y6DYS4_9CELL|nr:HEAT repeat domain-containing protein [Cellulomonas humilata]NUU18730.1 HEAT repeat domain-containing protein [Cellulomonas humilata]